VLGWLLTVEVLLLLLLPLPANLNNTKKSVITLYWHTKPQVYISVCRKIHERYVTTVTDHGQDSGFSGVGVSVLASGTQVHGFKPGRSRRIFTGGKFLSTPSFQREVKPWVPSPRFEACKRSLMYRGSGHWAKFPVLILPPISSNFRR
jgi:hypothetical protein